MTQHSIRVDAEDGAMTLDELRKFVDDCERANLPDTTVVNAAVTMRGKLKRVEAGA